MQQFSRVSVATIAATLATAQLSGCHTWPLRPDNQADSRLPGQQPSASPVPKPKPADRSASGPARALGSPDRRYGGANPPADLLEATSRKQNALSAPTRTVKLDEDAAVGRGYLMSTGSARSHSMNSAETIERDEHAVDYYFEYVANQRDFAKKLQVSAKGSYGGFSASANMLREKKIKSTNVYLLARMSVQSHIVSLKSHTMNAVALRRLQDSSEGGIARFRTAHGDGFISSVYFGGELVALMEFSFKSEQEREEFRVKASAKYGAGSGSASVSSDITDLTKNSSVKVSYAQTGGTGGLPVWPSAAASTPKFDPEKPFEKLSAGGVLTIDPAELIERVRRFPQEVMSPENKRFSKPIKAEVMDYAVAENFPSGVDSLSNLRGDWAVESALDAKHMLEGYVADALAILSVSKEEGGTPERQESARQRHVFGSFALDQLDRQFQVILSSSMVTDSMIDQMRLPSVYQYLSRRNFVDGGIDRYGKSELDRLFPKEAGDCDLSDPDRNRTITCLVGVGTSSALTVPVATGTSVVGAVRFVQAPHGTTHRAMNLAIGTSIVPGTIGWAGVDRADCGGATKDRALAICGFDGKNRFQDAFMTPVASAAQLDANRCKITAWNVTCLQYGSQALSIPSYDEKLDGAPIQQMVVKGATFNSIEFHPVPGIAKSEEGSYVVEINAKVADMKCATSRGAVAVEFTTARGVRARSVASWRIDGDRDAFTIMTLPVTLFSGDVPAPSPDIKLTPLSVVCMRA